MQQRLPSIVMTGEFDNGDHNQKYRLVQTINNTYLLEVSNGNDAMGETVWVLDRNFTSNTAQHTIIAKLLQQLEEARGL